MLDIIKKEQYLRKIPVTNAKKNLDAHLLVCEMSLLNKKKIEIEILNLRDELELAWCDETRYRGTLFNVADKISKGQCGVSSFHLAKILEQKNYEVLFCEGDAFFPSSSPILKHCWIKLFYRKEANQYLIIDITADQLGYDHKIVCMTKNELNKAGILYIPKKECRTQEVMANSLLERQACLEDRLKKITER